jgi:hypothetical protein
MKKIICWMISMTILIPALVFQGCNDDLLPGLEGTYTAMRTFDSGEHPVRLEFTTSGRLIWTPLEDIPGHTPSEVGYTRQGDFGFKIYDDPDCGNEGNYTFTLQENTLIITATEDNCEPRAAALSGTWARQN